MLQTIRVDVPRAFKPLLRSARYKGAYGGRGGAKSHFFAEQMVIRCFRETTRAVGIREVQLSIRDSVRQLLADKIQKLGLGQYFDVLDTEVRGHNGSNIIFRGMQSYNAETIKSLEGYDLAWVEEAQTLSQHSLDLLRPTIRKPGSELWFGWNPRFRTDPVDVFFRKADPADTDIVSVKVGWRDNPWFPDVLRKDMLRDRAADPELAEHIWEGGYAIGHGAILARQIDRIEKAGQINDLVDFDLNGSGIEVIHDIGRRDATAAWYVQRRVGGLAILDFDKDTGLEAREWIDRTRSRLDERGWPLGKIWLPPDARAKTFRSNLSVAEIFLKAFGIGNVEIIPATTIADQVNAARLTVPRCEFHATRCASALDELRSWEYEYDEETRIYSKAPVHSDTGSAFCYVAVTLRELPPPPPKKEPEQMRGAERMTVDELLSTVRPDRRWS